MKYNKIWGTTEQVYNGNNVEIHRIEINQGGYCSRHIHHYKHNMFFVESGKLQIEVWKNDSLVDKTVLEAGQSTSVAPNEPHRFTALAPTIAYEIYWVTLLPEDIQRFTQGGVENAAQERSAETKQRG